MTQQKRTSLSQLRWFADALASFLRSVLASVRRLDVRSPFVSWFLALLAPLFSIVALQILGMLGVFKFFPKIKDENASLFIFFVIALSPSYLLLLKQRMNWRDRLLSMALFTLAALCSAPLLWMFALFSACYLFGQCP